jgi:hypothetical protein
MEIGGEADPLWLSSQQAVDHYRIVFGADEQGARRKLVRLAADDFVRSWCVRFVRRVFDAHSLDPGETYDDDEILPQFWDDFDRHGTEADWKHGTFTAATSFKEVRVYGVRFSGRDLANHKRKLDGLPPLAPSQALPRPGRPQGSVETTLAELARLHPERFASSRGASSAPDDAMTRALKQERDALAREAFEGIAPTERRASPAKAGQPKPNRRAPPPSRQGPVTRTEFDTWHKTLSPEDQALGYRDLWPMAQRAFRPRKVVRKHAENLVRDLKHAVGRRRKNAPPGR